MTINLILLALALVYAIYMWRNKSYADLKIPDSGLRRKDLYYGYFACYEEQVAETKDHINLFMDAQFSGPIKMVQNIKDAGVDAAIDLSFQLFDRPVGAPFSNIRPDAFERLSRLFIDLNAAEVLDKVKILFPMDEPNNTLESVDVLTRAIAIVRAVAGNFPALANVKYACIYAADKPFLGFENFDYVGFDDYDKKSSILNGQYQELKASLLPGQKTILVPGGAYGQDPTPFLNFAQANPEVGILMPFLWYDDTMGSVGAPGIRSGALKTAYVAAGLQVCHESH